MTNTVVYYDKPEQVIPLPARFTAANGADTDPAAVVLVVTDPHGTATVYTAGTDPNHVVRDSTGVYHLWLMPFGANPKPPAGTWTYTWTGVGGNVVNGAQVIAGTVRVLSLDSAVSLQRWYCSKEDLKSRLNYKPGDDKDDFEMQLAIQSVTDWITTYCGQHFWRVTESRTYAPQNRWDLFIDPVVSVTSVDLDYDGDGVYEVHWVQDTDYQLLRYRDNYNAGNLGVARPNNLLQVTQSNTGSSAGGQWLPWLWPFTRKNRVKITGTFGWADIPPNVTQAALVLAADMFKAKDAPYGVAGFDGLGLVKVQSNPWIVELLRPYINVRAKVGVL